MELLFGIVAFILFIIYDIEQVRLLPLNLHRFAKFFFVIGFFLLFVATVLAVRRIGFDRLQNSVSACCYFVIAFLFLALLIYTLFFALPFNETYVKQNGQRTHDKGMYALCRHPGVLWFGGFYFFLWLALGSKLLLQMAVTYTVLNIGYVILQDKVVFPRIFLDYEGYKKRVPFLIPTFKSVKRCIGYYNKFCG